jgi:hypothetical protein
LGFSPGENFFERSVDMSKKKLEISIGEKQILLQALSLLIERTRDDMNEADDAGNFDLADELELDLIAAGKLYERVEEI